MFLLGIIFLGADNSGGWILQAISCSLTVGGSVSCHGKQFKSATPIFRVVILWISNAFPF